MKDAFKILISTDRICSDAEGRQEFLGAFVTSGQAPGAPGRTLRTLPVDLERARLCWGRGGGGGWVLLSVMIAVRSLNPGSSAPPTSGPAPLRLRPRASSLIAPRSDAPDAAPSLSAPGSQLGAGG